MNFKISQNGNRSDAVVLGYGDENPAEHATVKDNAFFIDKLGDTFFKKLCFFKTIY